MAKLPLTLACWDYDRMDALKDGSVVPDGIDINFLNMPVEETFFRMLKYKEFDVAELSLSSYCVSLMQDNPPFIAIPVYPSRFFRHSCIFVSKKSGIKTAADLVGKKIGVPEYQMTAPVWIRGILQDEYGVDPASVDYFTGGEEEPGRDEKIKLNLPDKFSVTRIGPEDTLSQMLADGEIDALHTARAPSTFYTRPDDVMRLFPNSQEVEKAYFKKTSIFPIMHIVAIRREIYNENPWVAQSLMKAFEESQAYAYHRLKISAALKTMMPWQIDSVESVMKEMGEDWWPYGFERNESTLTTFLRYHHEQGLSHRLLTPLELFAPETLSSFKI